MPGSEFRPIEIVHGDRRQAVDELPLAVVFCAADGAIVAMSRAAATLLGSRGPAGPDALVGLLTAAGVADAARRLADALTGEQDLSLRRGGREQRCLVRGQRTADGGTVHHLVAAVCDEEREAQRAEFQSLIAHDIRSPLAVIQGYAGLLASAEAGPLTATQREFLAGIDGKIAELVRLLDDFLDFSRLEAGALTLAIEPVAVGELLESVRQEHAVHSARRQLTVELAIAPEDLEVAADPLRLRQVVDNLLGNAIKYADPGSWIRLVARSEADRAVISIADGGPGLPAADLARLFEPYQRVAGPGEAIGTGLGLVVVRRLVEAHGGTVTVERVLDAGLRFVTTWPLDARQPLGSC